MHYFSQLTGDQKTHIEVQSAHKKNWFKINQPVKSGGLKVEELDLMS